MEPYNETKTFLFLLFCIKLSDFLGLECSPFHLRLWIQVTTLWRYTFFRRLLFLEIHTKLCKPVVISKLVDRKLHHLFDIWLFLTSFWDFFTIASTVLLIGYGKYDHFYQGWPNLINFSIYYTKLDPVNLTNKTTKLFLRRGKYGGHNSKERTLLFLRHIHLTVSTWSASLLTRNVSSHWTSWEWSFSWIPIRFIRLIISVICINHAMFSMSKLIYVKLSWD